MRRLTTSEREIRSSRGVWITRLWPFALMLLAAITMSVDSELFQQCVGRPLDGGGGRIGALIRLVFAIPCSPYYLHGSVFHKFIFGSLWGPIPFAVLQILWIRRHGAYWDRIRAREKIRRAERRATASVPADNGLEQNSSQKSQEIRTIGS
jgi:hypothetical protein